MNRTDDPTRASDNFTLFEVTNSQIAARLGIDNSLPDELLPAVRHVAETILEPVRAHYARPIVPSSWYRCEALERAINWGGRGASSAFGRWCIKRKLDLTVTNWKRYFARKQHPKGFAVDFEVPGVANRDLAEWCRDNLDFDQLILEMYRPDIAQSGWVHCSTLLERPNRNQVLRID